MRKNFKLLVIICAISTVGGLLLGYLLIEKNGMGTYIDISTLFFPGEDLFKNLGNKLGNVASIRWNVLLSGIAGLSIGGNIYHFLKK